MIDRRSFVAAGASLAILRPTSSRAAIAIRATDFGPERGARAESLLWMAEDLAARTDGELSMAITWGGALIKSADVLSGVGSGFAELGYAVASYTALLRNSA